MHSMNNSASCLLGMLPFDQVQYEQTKPRFIFKVPRVVPDQKAKYESDELFRRLSRESEVRYTNYRDHTLKDRQNYFRNGCLEGHAEIAHTITGTNFQLAFAPPNSRQIGGKECDLDKEPGKVHIKSSFIMNGVCVRWRGWLDLERLDGVGCLEFCEETALQEDAVLKERIDKYNQKMKEFQEKQKVYRQPERPQPNLGLRMDTPLHGNYMSLY